ncbi:MAG: PAS domain S-box-containing protein [Phenylobacterium sp.]|jgi:PAS domain S-box-containing protein
MNTELLQHPLLFLLLGIAGTVIAKPLYHQLSVLMSNKNLVIKAQLKAIGSSLTDGFVIIDKNGSIIHVNTALLTLFGYSEQSQLLEQNISILMMPEESDHHDQFLAYYDKTGTRKFLGTDRQIHAKRHDGSTIHIKISINEIQLGSVPYFTAFIRDISAEVEIYRLVEHQRNKFETLFNYCPDGILYVSTELKVLDANEQFLLLHGSVLKDVLQKDLNSLFNVDIPQLEYVKNLLRGMDETWGANEVLARMNHQGEQDVTVLISHQKIPKAEGDLYIYMFRDISNELDLIAHTAEKNQTLALSETLVNIGYWRYDTDKRQLWCSDRIFTILAMPVPEDNLLEVEDIYALVHPQDQQNAIDAVQQCFAHHIPLALSIKLTLDPPDGCSADELAEDINIRHIVLKGISKVAGGKLTTLYGVIQDISDQLGQAEKLSIANERLERSQLFSNIGNWEWDITSGQVYWSALTAPMFGDKKEILTTDFGYYVSTVHPDDRENVSSAISRCIEQAEKYDIEHRVIWPDQSIHWLHQQGDVVRDLDGIATSMVGVVQDVTERKDKESQLMLFKQLIESSSQAIRVSTDNGQLIYANPAHQQLFLHNQTFAAHQFDDFLSKDFKLSGVSQQIEQSLSRANHWSGEAESQRTDGSSFPAHVSMSQFNDQQNKQKYRFSFCYDASEEIAQNEHLRQAKRDAESASRAKSEFLSSMSHELRTPLNAVLGFSQLLLRQKQVPFTERITENIGAIYKAGEHLLTLINGILELAKIESGQSTPNVAPINIKEVIDESVHLITPQAHEHGLSLQTPDGGKIPVLYTQRKIPVVEADFTLLKQALLNYLSNAIKYNKKDGIIFITVDINEDNKTTRITVCDNGIGIAAESISQLFTPFNRLGLETSSVQGTGIGLAITKKNIENLNGQVGVKSKLGAGSSFWIDLPYIDLLADDAPSSANQPEALINQYLTFGNNSLCVLYIEDNASNTALMKGYFDSMEQTKLITATNAEVGTVMACEYLPQIVLLDLNLPGMDGYAALSEMKNNTQLANTAYIAVTADVMSKTREKVRQAGFDAFLSKPISFDALQQLLNRFSETDKRKTKIKV